MNSQVKAFDSATKDFTSEEMAAIVAKQRESFLKEGPVSYETRINRLDRLAKLLHDNQDALVECMSQDFGHRSSHQSLIADFYACYEGIKHHKKELKKWMKPEKRRSPMPLNFLGARSEVQYQPKGVIGNITTWNFPIFVAIGPLIGILAAGNRSVVKLTEVTPRTSNLLAKLFEKYFDETEVAGVTGGPETGAAFSALELDHIVFTGATSIGKHVLRGAAENLTPVTLELGGKSPVVVSQSYDPAEAALRIFTGKALNAGQVCISPDYAFVHETQLADFIREATNHVTKMFPTMVNNKDYSSIINARHQARIQSYIDDAIEKGAEVRVINPGNEDFSQQNGTHKLPMTLVINPTDDMLIMQEEIFGPVVAIKSYSNIQEPIQYINAHARPLALYYFGNDNDERDKVLAETTSGGVCVNDVIAHCGNEDIPFGGIGPSGMGNYHGFDGFKTFSHAKGVFKQSKIFMMKHTNMIPPYNKKTDQAIKFMTQE